MNLLNQFLWLIYPYVALTVFVGGHIYRARKEAFAWTSKSSEILEKPLLKWGSTLFHWGILAVLGGHVAGLLVPMWVYEKLGVPDELYHTFALIMGLVFGLTAVTGAGILVYRRLSVKRVRVQSQTSDYVALALLALTILGGLVATATNATAGFEYRTTISPWMRGILTLRPDPSLMTTVPFWFQVHVLSALTLFGVWPFTRLVHVLSVPLSYLGRSYILYRRRQIKGHLPF